MSVNEELVAAGLRVLRGPLSLFVCRGIETEYGDTWWTEGVLETLVSRLTPSIEDVRRYRRLPESGTADDCDISVCLILLTKHWWRIFGPMLGKDQRGWAYELIGVRNENKHSASGDHASDFAWRALDTMYRLIESIDADAARELLGLRSSVDLSAYGQASAAEVSTSAPARVAGTFAASTPRPPGLDSPITAETDLDEDLAAVGPDFSGADLRNMNFGGANLVGADFEGANLARANLKGAKLAGANFKGATLSGADLTSADLTGAAFEDTVLSSGPEWAANLSGATLDKATLNFAGCNLSSVNFGAVNLAGADFEGANLARANLKGADLRGVNLRNANMTNADTTDVRWT